jgi:HEAT repeat protein
VVVLGATEGLRWELETILALGKPEKLLIVVPPIFSKFLNERWERFSAVFRDRIGRDLPKLDPRIVLLSFSNDWEIQIGRDPGLKRDSLLRARSRHYEDYLGSALPLVLTPSHAGNPNGLPATTQPHSGGTSAARTWKWAGAILVGLVFGSIMCSPPLQERVEVPERTEPVVANDVDLLRYDGRPLSDVLVSLESRSILDIVWTRAALSKVGPEAKVAVPRLIAVLRGDDAFSYLAASALIRIGPGATPGLVQALRSPHDRIREGAANVLGRLGPAASHAIPALVRAQKDKARDVRYEATEALGKMGAEALPALSEALLNIDPLAREEAAKALGKLGPPAVDPLLGVMQDKEWEVRCSASEALGQIGSDAGRAVAALVRALDDRDETVRIVAARALGRIGPGARSAVSRLLEALRQGSKDLRASVADPLVEIDPAAEGLVAALGAALSDDDRDVRVSAVEALGRLGPAARPVLDRLRGALEDKDPVCRMKAAVALWKVSGEIEPTVRFLIRALKDKDVEARPVAAIMLGTMGPAAQAAVPALTEARADKSSGVDSYAKDALEKIVPAPGNPTEERR